MYIKLVTLLFFSLASLASYSTTLKFNPPGMESLSKSCVGGSAEIEFYVYSGKIEIISLINSKPEYIYDKYAMWFLSTTDSSNASDGKYIVTMSFSPKGCGINFTVDTELSFKKQD